MHVRPRTEVENVFKEAGLIIVREYDQIKTYRSASNRLTESVMIYTLKKKLKRKGLNEA